MDAPTLTTQVLTSTPTPMGSTGSPGEVTSDTLGYTPSVTPSSSSSSSPEHTDSKPEG